ncbi:3',5'-cyclic-nucleotide phosphodiesterase [Savitreella phatthalungensis]
MGAFNPLSPVDKHEQARLISSNSRVALVDARFETSTAFTLSRTDIAKLDAFLKAQDTHTAATTRSLLAVYDHVNCFGSAAALHTWLGAAESHLTDPTTIFVHVETSQFDLATSAGLLLLADVARVKPQRCFIVACSSEVTADLTTEYHILTHGADELYSYPLEIKDATRAACLTWKKFGYMAAPPLELKDGSKNYERPEVTPTMAEWQALNQRMRTAHLGDKSSVSRMFHWHLPFDKIDSDRAGGFDTVFLAANSRRVQSNISTWGFSSLLLGEQELLFYPLLMLRHVLTTLNDKRYDLPDSSIFAFLEIVKDTYFATNPYHNFRHAVDVMQAIFYFLLSAGYLPPMHDGCPTFQPISCTVLPRILNPKYMLAAMLVGIGHDCGHPGVNNALLVAIKSPLALLYNDRSVLENLHSVTLCHILSRYWPACQDKDMRKIIMELVLSTDMALHFDYMSKIKEMETICLETRKANDPNVDIPQEAIDKFSLMLFAALTKCADISNVARPFNVSQEWSNVLLREFFNQGRLEESLGMPVTKTFDPEQTRQADSQVFFINLFAAPLFNSLTKIMPTMTPLMTQIQANKETWLASKESTGAAIPADAAAHNVTTNGSAPAESTHASATADRPETSATIGSSDPPDVSTPSTNAQTSDGQSGKPDVETPIGAPAQQSRKKAVFGFLKRNRKQQQQKAS